MTGAGGPSLLTVQRLGGAGCACAVWIDALTQAVRLVLRLPLEAAAQAGLLRFGHRLGTEHEIDGGAKRAAIVGHVVGRAGAIHLAPVGELAVGAVKEEVRRARRTVGLRHLLCLIDQVREIEACPPRLLGQVRRIIVWVPGRVVAADPDRGEAGARVVGDQLAETALDVPHIRAVVGEEDHEQRGCVSEVPERDRVAADRRELEVGSGCAERHHERAHSRHAPHCAPVAAPSRWRTWPHATTCRARLRQPGPDSPIAGPGSHRRQRSPRRRDVGRGHCVFSGRRSAAPPRGRSTRGRVSQIFGGAERRPDDDRRRCRRRR